MLRLRNEYGGKRGQQGEGPIVLEQSIDDPTARLRATIEEELGRFRRFADVPATELEEMASRLVRAIAPLVTVDEVRPASRAA